VFQEEKIRLIQQKEILKAFEYKVKLLDEKQANEMRTRGWRYVKTGVRTVVFTFGEVTFSRRCYEKKGVYCYPVDAYLKLPSHTRFSYELLFEVARLATRMSYRKVAETFQEMKNLFITKDTVMKAVKLAGELYKEQEDYRYFKDYDLIEKIKVDTIYVEGDGIVVKTPNGEKERTDLSHFVIHQGVKTEYGNRKQLKDKYEILCTTNRQARDQLMDYLYNYYEFQTNTLLVTNSDMGSGYTAYVFDEIAKAFGCRHEHFWDAYHLNRRIKNEMKAVPIEQRFELQEGIFEGIRKHNKKGTSLYLDTAESLIEDIDKMEIFGNFRKKLLNNFQYTKSAKLRNLPNGGIGIMESQHCKIANRMKNQGMYWSVSGATTMARMIIDHSLGRLKNLFFGNWRDDYERYKDLPGGAAQYVEKIDDGKNYKLPQGYLSWIN
jgi:hypothetical protein